jgi:hypothetical protein
VRDFCEREEEGNKQLVPLLAQHSNGWLDSSTPRCFCFSSAEYPAAGQRL